MPLLFIRKSPKHTKFKYTLLSLLAFVLIQLSVANATDTLRMIDLSSLGSFKADFSTVEKVEYMKGQSLIGEISYMTGDNYSVLLPFDVQRISYQVKNGSYVNKGDTIAVVEGYDVHHFIDQYHSTKKLLDVQEMHFQTNKKYFENKTIKSSQWIDITKSYYEAKLNFEHIKHQMSFLHIDENERISFVSPKSGVIKTPHLVESKVAKELVFDIVELNAIKAKITVPLSLASNLSHFEVHSTCRLKISSIEKIADKFHQILWAQPSSNDCKFTLGQLINVVPVNSIQGYKIYKSAVFEFDNSNYIAIKVEDKLSLVPINIIGSSDGQYIFSTKENIEGRQGLVSSVSILQGSLLNLGVE